MNADASDPASAATPTSRGHEQHEDLTEDRHGDADDDRRDQRGPPARRDRRQEVVHGKHDADRQRRSGTAGDRRTATIALATGIWVGTRASRYDANDTSTTKATIAMPIRATTRKPRAVRRTMSRSGDPAKIRANATSIAP